MPKSTRKVVVFDLDDTIGHFEEIAMFLSGLQFIVGREIREIFLFKLLDMWPKFLRPRILDMLKLLKEQKKKNRDLRVAIYTNNMGPRSWTLLIKRYLERKIKSKLFDRTITAYRPFSKLNCRSTHEKTHKDFIKCSLMPKDTKILFLDDQFHHHMIHPSVRYIHLHPYNYGMPYHTMITTFLQSKAGRIIPRREHDKFREYMHKFLSSGKGEHRYTIQRTHISRKDIRESRRIEATIKRFLNIRTRRKYRKKKRKNKTRKAK